MKIENIEGKNGIASDTEKLSGLYNRIIDINRKYPGIITQEYLELIQLKSSKI